MFLDVIFVLALAILFSILSNMILQDYHQYRQECPAILQASDRQEILSSSFSSLPGHRQSSEELPLREEDQPGGVARLLPRQVPGDGAEGFQPSFLHQSGEKSGQETSSQEPEILPPEILQTFILQSREGR